MTIQASVTTSGTAVGFQERFHGITDFVAHVGVTQVKARQHLGVEFTVKLWEELSVCVGAILT